MSPKKDETCVNQGFEFALIIQSLGVVSDTNEISVEYDSLNINMTHSKQPSIYDDPSKPSLNMAQAHNRIQDHRSKRKAPEVCLKSVVEEQDQQEALALPMLQSIVKLSYISACKPRARLSLGLTCMLNTKLQHSRVYKWTTGVN